MKRELAVVSITFALIVGVFAQEDGRGADPKPKPKPIAAKPEFEFLGESRTLAALKENREPSDDELGMLGGTYSKWKTETLPGPRIDGKIWDDRELSVRVWIPNMMSFPGINAPAVEIYHKDKRLAFQVLEEVSMPEDAWVGGDQSGKQYLYVKTSYRSRLIKGTLIYKLNAKTLVFEHVGDYYAKEDIARERKFRKNRISLIDPVLKKQAAAQEKEEPESGAEQAVPGARAEKQGETEKR